MFDLLWLRCVLCSHRCWKPSQVKIYRKTWGLQYIRTIPSGRCIFWHVNNISTNQAEFYKVEFLRLSDCGLVLSFLLCRFCPKRNCDHICFLSLVFGHIFRVYFLKIFCQSTFISIYNKESIWMFCIQKYLPNEIIYLNISNILLTNSYIVLIRIKTLVWVF